MKSEEQREPDIQVVFTDGDYNHALICYDRAKNWVLDTGQCFRLDMHGHIGRPRHPESPEEERSISGDRFEILEDPRWNVEIRLWAATKETFDWLKSLPLPKDAVSVSGEWLG